MTSLEVLPEKNEQYGTKEYWYILFPLKRRKNPNISLQLGS